MQKQIKTIVLAMALILLGAPAGVMAQQTSWLAHFTAPGLGTVVNARNSRIAFSRIMWYFDGNITSCSVKVEQSDYGVTWTDLIILQDCSSERKFEFITPPLNKVIRFNVPVLTGGGIVHVFWEGLTGEGCGKNYSGVMSVVVGPDPATGEELSIVIPAHERWRVYSAGFDLQANGVLADREVFLTASKGGNEYFRTFADGVVKANQKGIFTTAALGFVGTAGLGPSSINQPADVRTIMIPIYSDTFVPGGHTLSTDTGGMQTGDDYGSASVLVEICPN